MILIGTQHQLKKVVFNSITVDGAEITTKNTVKNLGVFIDSDLWMKSQINSVVKVCYIHIHMLRKVKNCMNKQALHTLVQAFVISRLDYANSLYHGIPEYLIRKLQRVQNMAARLICNIGYRDRITPSLIDLHWLPVKQRIEFKICVLTYKSLHNTGPDYLNSLLVLNSTTRRLRSSNAPTLTVPKTKLKHAGDRAFRVTAPRLWNNLPQHIRNQVTLLSFKAKLTVM